MLNYMYYTCSGKVEWKSLFQSATDIADGGFEITERMFSGSETLLGLKEGLSYSYPDNKLFFRDLLASEFFLDGCEPKPAGTPITNPEYAKTTKGIAEYGSDFFYYGDVAEAVVKAVATDPSVPGDLSMEDLANYDIVEREPVCCEYKTYNVCGMGPPSSGALAICQQLGMLETCKSGSIISAISSIISKIALTLS